MLYLRKDFKIIRNDQSKVISFRQNTLGTKLPLMQMFTTNRISTIKTLVLVEFTRHALDDKTDQEKNEMLNKNKSAFL